MAHTIAFVTPVVDHLQEQEIAQVHHEGLIWRPIAPLEEALLLFLCK